MTSRLIATFALALCLLTLAPVIASSIVRGIPHGGVTVLYKNSEMPRLEG